MIKGVHGPTKMLHALTWGAFDHASHAPQVRVCRVSYSSIVPCIAVVREQGQ